MFADIAVLGAGAWGTALANVAAEGEGAPRVYLWTRDAADAQTLAVTRENRRRLPGVALHPGVRPTADLGIAAAADLVLVALPAQSLRGLLGVLPTLRPRAPILLCAKGIEQGTGLLPGQVVQQLRPLQPVAALSGPSFAADVGRGRPTAVTVAAEDIALARGLAAALARPAFRLYYTDDLRGVEIGGAAKNVLAIGCGIAAGLDLGASASAALIARGFAELARFGQAFGARPETLMGLSGLGDLVLTCSSAQSRNFAFGQALGQGVAPGAAAAGRLVEGAATAVILCDLAAREQVDMPIASCVAEILAGRLAPSAARAVLLARPFRAESGV